MNIFSRHIKECAKYELGHLLFIELKEVLLIPWNMFDGQEWYRWKFGHLSYPAKSWYFKLLSPPFDSSIVGVITHTLDHEVRIGLVGDSSEEDNDEDRYQYWEDSKSYEDDDEDSPSPG